MLNYEQIFTAAPVPICMHEHDGKIRATNPAFCQLLGYTEAALLQISFWQLVPTNHRQDKRKAIEQMLAGNINVEQNECEYLHRGGHILHLLENCTLVHEPVSQTGYLIYQFQDISLRIENEQRLQLIQQRYNLSQRHANFGVWDLNIQTNDLYWSKQIGPLLGYANEEIEANYSDFIAAIHPDDLDYVNESVRAAIEDHADYDIEHRVVWADGSIHWLRETGDVIHDDDGKPLKMIGVTQEITARRHTDEALKRNTEQLKYAQQIAHLGHWSWDVATGQLYWSDEIYRIFGYQPGKIEPTYEKFIATLHPDDIERIKRLEEQAFTNGKPHRIDHRIIRQDDTEAWVHKEAIAITDQNGDLIQLTGTVQDITERKKLEQILSDKQALLELLRNSMTHFMATSDIRETATILLNGLLLLTNSEYGFTSEILRDEDDNQYIKIHAITDISWDDATRKLFESQDPQGLEFHNLNNLFGAAITQNKVVISNDPRNDERSGGLPEGHPALNHYLGIPVYHGDEMVGMYGLANRPGGYDEALVEFLELFNTTYGVIIQGYRGMQREQQIKTDLEHAKQQAEAANFTKSAFLSHMSHELRTPLNAILGFAQIMEMEDLPEMLAFPVKEIMASGWHLLDLVNDLLDLSKVETGDIELQIEAINVNDLLDECHSMISPLLKKRQLSFIKSYQSPEYNYSVNADRRRLKQVVVNLLSNAIKYNTLNGEIEVSCSQHNHRLRINVRDSGQGIAKDLLPRLFTPFDRLGKEGIEESGTGIGLTLVKRLTENMDGNIGVESTPGTGSTFWVEFDISDAKNIGIREGQGTYKAGGKSTTKSISQVLCVEDNHANLRLIENFFARHKHLELMTASNATTGLAMALEHKPDVILMDIKLPDMNGFEALARLRSQPTTENIPVIAVSAIAHEHDIAAGLNAGFYRYLTKPLNLKELEEAIHYALHNA